MKVIGFAGFSGAGKTTLVERLIVVLKRHGQRVSVIKHAHHRFDIDHPGKDSWRHREAGAFEVLVASAQRLALMREFEQPTELGVHALIAELDPGVDWVLVEGFRHGDLPKIEVWRAAAGEAAEEVAEKVQAPRPVLYPDDGFIVAVATDAPSRLPQPTALPLFDLGDADGIGAWLLSHADEFEYKVKHHG
jgi:molybdopterin-guanine dinucleotide biosynthesis adapter protein